MPCLTVCVISFFILSKHMLMRLALVSDMPANVSCLSNALLVFRTRRPSVAYVQKMSRDIRDKWGEDFRIVDMTDPKLTVGQLE